MKKLFFIFTVITLSYSCRNNTTSEIPENELAPTVVHRLTEVIVYDIFSPPVASRIYAYSNLAFYEAIRFSDKNAGSVTAQMKGFNPMPEPLKEEKYDFHIAAVHAFFKTAKALTFSKDSLAQTEKQILDQYKESTDKKLYDRSYAFGDTIAATVLKRAAGDNYKKTRGMPKYSVFRETGKWTQTPPDYADAAEPHWNLIQPFLMDSASHCMALPPPEYDLHESSKYYAELKEVVDTKANLTPAQDSIARYWDDNPFVTNHAGHFAYATKKTTPGGHWMGIIGILCKQSKADLIKTARAYALTSCAIFDAFIACWTEKYKYRTVRPVTVIREVFDSSWSPVLQTPPFPEFPSGHSVITAAASTVLTKIFGNGFAFRDTTEMEFLGMARSFNSIQQAADEAAISRLYGGIHYRSAIECGKKQGQAVGALYNARF